MSDDLWKRDDIQFPRLLAEIWGVGIGDKESAALLETMDLTEEEVNELFERADREWQFVKAHGPDEGCSESGNTFSGYGLSGTCEIRREPCPRACLMKTIRSLKLDRDSRPLHDEVRARMFYNRGLEAAAKAIRSRGGSKGMAEAVLGMRKKPDESPY